MENIHYHLYNQIQTVGGLACKVAREVADPTQFLDGNRRSQLINHGVCTIRGAFIKPGTIETITGDIRKTFQEVTQGDVYFAISEKVPAVAVVFPLTSKIHYFPNGTPIEIGGEDSPEFWITSTTTHDHKAEGFTGLPSEGYQDHTGIQSPFVERDCESQIQHGGLLIDNSSGLVRVVDYARLLEARNTEVEDGQIIIEANWYMDSTTQELVANRKNLLHKNSYNCIGILGDREDSQSDLYFTINPDCTSSEKLSKRVHLPEYKYRDVNMIEIASVCNVLAQRFESNSWRVAGLEFHGGGTFFPSNQRARIFTHRDYFKLTV